MYSAFAKIGRAYTGYGAYMRWGNDMGRRAGSVRSRSSSTGAVALRIGAKSRGAKKKPTSNAWRKFHHTATSVRRLCLLVVLDVNSRRVGQMPPFSDDILPGLRISLCVVLRAVRTGAAETHPTHPILAKGPIARIAPI